MLHPWLQGHFLLICCPPVRISQALVHRSELIQYVVLEVKGRIKEASFSFEDFDARNGALEQDQQQWRALERERQDVQDVIRDCWDIRFLPCGLIVVISETL